MGRDETGTVYPNPQIAATFDRRKANARWLAAVDTIAAFHTLREILIAQTVHPFIGGSMGLFDKLTGHSDVALTPQAGLLLAAITMVAIDGDVDDDEIAVIRRLDGSQSTTAWEMALKYYKTKPVSDCVSAAARSMDQRQRLIAMANLIDIAMADGGLAGSEKELLGAYVSAFAVPEAEIGKIVDVISVKNNKAAFQ